jgi:hypothetical protein
MRRSVPEAGGERQCRAILRREFDAPPLAIREGTVDVTPPRRPSGATVGVLAAAIALAVLVVVASQRRRDTTHSSPQPHPPARVEPDPFRSIAPDTLPIAWRDWDAAAFQVARERRLPLAVLVDTAWSESCRLYETAIAAHAPAHAALDRLVAVHVDADRRPDIFERYCASSLPAWVLLSPSGSVLQVMDAVPPAALARRLAGLHAEPEPARADPGVEALRTQVPVPPPTSDLVAAADAVVSALRAEWPAEGAALEPHAPFLEGDMLELLAVRAGAGDAASGAAYDDALRRVAAIVSAAGAIDQDWFASSDRLHRGRFLATHAVWLAHWQRAVANGDAPPGVIDAALQVRAWLDSTLWNADRGLYRAAQGTLVLHAGRPALTAAERARMLASGHATVPPPHVVEVYPTAANARAAVALIETPVGAPDVAARRARGMQILNALRRAWRDTGHVPHDFAPDAGGALRPGACEWMADVADLGRALLAAAAATSSADERAALQRDALDLGRVLRDRFTDPETGLLLDVPPAPADAPPRSRVRLAPLADGGRAASFWCDLAAVTGDARWEHAARRALSGWTRAVRGHDATAAAPFAAAATILGARP